jgi:hypothetical protein
MKLCFDKTVNKKNKKSTIPCFLTCEKKGDGDFKKWNQYLIWKEEKKFLKQNITGKPYRSNTNIWRHIAKK